MTGNKDVQKDGPKYSREDLLANAGSIFNCKPEVMAGALHGISETEFSLDQMKKIIDRFLQKGVC